MVPKDAKQKALVEQWISVEMSHYKVSEVLVGELMFKKMFGKGAPDATIVDENTKKLHNFYKILEKHLEGKTYIVGDDFTLAGMVDGPNI